MKLTRIQSIAALICTIGLLSAGCEKGNYHTEVMQQSEHKQVQQRIVTMVNAIDTKHWELATAQFVDNVYEDY